MNIVIGSKALQFYGLLSDRVPADWDIISPMVNPMFPNIEITSVNHPQDKTNKEIYEYCLKHSIHEINTPIGTAKVAPLEILKVLKVSCEGELNKFKHSLDLKNLDHITLDTYLIDLSIKRKEEIKKRVKNQNNFFNKYNIPRYINHDEIHKEINKHPTYLKALKNEVEICQILFSDLSLQDKINIIREETFVLALERYFIYNYKKNPASLYKLSDSFQQTKTSSDPMIYWLQKMSLKGQIKDHPDWLAQWTEDNYLVILSGMDLWWSERFHNISKDFWTNMFYPTSILSSDY